MPRLGLVLVALVVVVAGGVVLTNVVMARARALAQADWLVGKNLTLAPVVKGLKEPTFVAGPPDGSKRLFMLEREGRIRVAGADGNLKRTPVLDLSDNT